MRRLAALLVVLLPALASADPPITSSETILIEERAPKAPATPLKKRQRPLPYSDEAMDQNLWARVWVVLDIDETGKVTAVRLVTRAGAGLDEIAVKEAMSYRFNPARDAEGKAVPTRVMWLFEWESYWRKTLVKSTGLPPCRGSGPLRVFSYDPVYRDCTVPTEKQIRAALGTAPAAGTGPP